jgi:hypothetical protein
MSPVRYDLGFYIPEDDILHSHRRENLKSYEAIIGSESVQIRCSGAVSDVYWSSSQWQ